jgi:hypothetical protein
LAGVQVWNDRFPEGYVVADSLGRFELSGIARLDRFQFVHPLYRTVTQYIQIWPDTVFDIPVAMQIFPQATYPLNVGDFWDWGSVEMQIIGDTIMANGKRYQIINDQFFIPFRFQRREGNRVFVFGWGAVESEFLLFDFSMQVGDIINTIHTQTSIWDISLVWYGEELLFDRVRRQWGVWVDARESVDEERYYVITDSIGITHWENYTFTADIQGAIVNGRQYGTVSAQENELVPEFIRLFQNYPNPFNPSTRIEYQLPRKEFVTLKVYDVLGREVAVLVNEVQSPGTHSVEFSATGLASGVYFYRLESGGFVETKRLVLLR